EVSTLVLLGPPAMKLLSTMAPTITSTIQNAGRRRMPRVRSMLFWASGAQPPDQSTTPCDSTRPCRQVARTRGRYGSPVIRRYTVAEVVAPSPSSADRVAQLTHSSGLPSYGWLYTAGRRTPI